MGKGCLAPKEIFDYAVDGGAKKEKKSNMLLLIGAIMAGIFVGMGALSSNVGAYKISNYGAAKLVIGVIFPVGIMFIIILGAELFTSNCMLSMGVWEKKISFKSMLRILAIVYVGNFIGTFVIAALAVGSGMFDGGAGSLGAFHLKVALSKLGASSGQAFLSGILCNIIVCAAVLIMYSAKDTNSKIWAGFFPIFAFAIAGFQHSVANMYYFSAAVLAKGVELYAQVAKIGSAELFELTWGHIMVRNLLPVTLGNIVGGSLIVGGLFWYVHSSRRT